MIIRSQQCQEASEVHPRAAKTGIQLLQNHTTVEQHQRVGQDVNQNPLTLNAKPRGEPYVSLWSMSHQPKVHGWAKYAKSTSRGGTR